MRFAEALAARRGFADRLFQFDVVAVELRLVQMARERYLDPLKQLRGPASR
ncbi:MAG: hypothetical protein ACKOFI_04585 [Phycisphaerales bacterium]